MSKITLRALAGAALLSGLACGGSDGGPSYSSSIDPATATTAANEAAYFAQDLSGALLGWGFSTQLPSGVRGTTSPNAPERLLAWVRQRAFMRAGMPGIALAPSPYRVGGVCTPVETGIDDLGAPVDSDNDGIPNDYKVDFGSSCTDINGDYTTTFSGSMRIRDVGAFFGYRIDIVNMKIRSAHLTEYEEVRVNGVEQGTFSASSIAHTLDADYGMSYSYLPAAPEIQLVAPVTGNTTFSVNATTTYTPSSAITLGAPIPSGSLAFSVDYALALAGNDGAGRYHFAVATTPSLAIQASPCAGPVSGVIDGELNGNADIGFTATWTACNTFTVVTRGTTGPAVVAAR